MADAAVSFLLQQLTTLLHDELNLLGGLRQEIQSIKHELETLRVFLKVADAKEETDPSLKECVGQLREISYDLQDVLDKYLLRFGRPRSTNGFVRFLNKVGDSIKNLKARREIASEIRTLNSELQRAVRSQQMYRDVYSTVDHGSSSTVAGSEDCAYDGRGDALFLEEEDVVGIKKPKKQLLDWIWSMDSGLDVISVVGMGGLGKTTLVKRVYDEESIKTYFDRHVWIAVSDYKNDRHFLENLIKKLMGEIKESHPQGLDDMGIDEMRGLVSKFLEGKKFILVLDDVWRQTTWEVMKFALPRKGGHGCVIITTRNNNIGKEACSERETSHVYNLKPLSEKKSKELFFKKVFKKTPCPDYLMGFAESILKRCEGLPLAIIVIGGLLATKERRAEVWELFNRSLGYQLEEGKRLWRLFSVSYNDLPYYLKYCFSYLSIFPEGGLLEKEKMLRLWTAEGFVQLKPNLNLEEVAAAYLNDLCSRGLLQVAEKHTDGRSRGFRIHDLLRDYITSKSREHNIVTVYNGQQEPWPNDHKIRRLAVQNSVSLSTELIESTNVEHLRSLILSNGGMEMRLIKEFVTRCRLLKVLDLRGAPIESIPDEVFKLYHLNYLCFRNTMIKVIPKSIKYLQKLETLDLKNTEVIQLPREILKLRRLRHILVYKYKVEDWYIVSFGHMQSFRAPYNIGSLEHLQKLCFVDGDEVTVREIGKLTQLRRLGIAKLRSQHGNALCSSISNLTSLQSLTIGSSEESEKLDLDYSLSSQSLPFLRALFLSGCMERVPQWVISLHSLSTLHLRWSKSRLDPLGCLQDLPSLTYLLIQDAYFEGLNFQAHGFKKLKVIRLYDLQFMKWMIVEEGSMPSLKKWEVCNCEILTEAPQGIEQLENLEKLSFHDMPEEFVNMIVEGRRREGDNWRLAHVPYIYFSIKRNNGFREYISLDEMSESYAV